MSRYLGEELDIFAAAQRWKLRLRQEIGPYLEAPVLEVGAGFGATTAALRSAVAGPWTALEPDPLLARRLADRPELDCAALVGDLAAVSPKAVFRSILYIDVLEHIHNDRAEVAAAFARLEAGGRLIVVAPAHPWVYSAFDRAVGHHRRYDRSRLTGLTPAGAMVERVRQLDSGGLLLNLGNRLLLRRRLPTSAQIRFWDRFVVPLSRWIDPLFGYRFGRSLLVVWRRG